MEENNLNPAAVERELHNCDCFDLMEKIPDQSVDLILCDLPYGTSSCRWDKVLPMDRLWEHYKRIVKPSRAIVLFASEPFTSHLILSNLEMWKYNWTWVKEHGTNFLNVKYCPFKVVEDICVFSDGGISPSSLNPLKYNPQFDQAKPYIQIRGERKETSVINNGTGATVTVSDGKRYPTNLLKFNRDKEKLHPTQKPVALLEYLIRTYTDENDLVLDCCMGSGSTGVACVRTGRRFIGCELDEKYFKIAEERIRKEECNLNK